MEEHLITHAMLREEAYLRLPLGPAMEVPRLHGQLSLPRNKH